jgi:hypothetical protein
MVGIPKGFGAEEDVPPLVDLEGKPGGMIQDIGRREGAKDLSPCKGSGGVKGLVTGGRVRAEAGEHP